MDTWNALLETAVRGPSPHGVQPRKLRSISEPFAASMLVLALALAPASAGAQSSETTFGQRPAPTDDRDDAQTAQTIYFVAPGFLLVGGFAGLAAGLTRTGRNVCSTCRPVIPPEFWPFVGASIAFVAIGLVVLGLAIGLDITAHEAERRILGEARLRLSPGPGDIGLGMALTF